MLALEDMSMTKGDSATRAGGLLSKYKQGNTLLALVMASDIMGVLETLNASLQSRQNTISGVKAAIEQVLTSREAKRNDAILTHYIKSLKQQAEFDLEVLANEDHPGATQDQLLHFTQLTEAHYYFRLIE